MISSQTCWPLDQRGGHYYYYYYYYLKLKVKSVAYSFQESHTGQLDFCNWLVDGSYDGIMWLALRSFKSNNVDFLNQIRYFSIK